MSREDTLVQRALSLPPDARLAYLDEACGDDDALRERVLALLAGHERPSDEMQQPTRSWHADPRREETCSWQPRDPETLDTDRAPLQDGPSFGEYQLLAKIAQGGMGVVYRAFHRKLRRTVALKMILAGRLASESDVRRFYLEAEAAAGLDHPGIVPLYEAGEQDGQHFLAMAFVEGGSLHRRLKDGPLAPREAAGLVKQIAEALAYAHGRGVIHRDLKPGNILLDQDGQPRISDFGLAKLAADDSHLTVTGQVLGTPSYMPPEQAEGRSENVGPSADIYSLGAVLYCLLTGRPPFQAASTLETLAQVKQREPVSPRQLNSAVDRDLETICLKCLQKEPRKRYASAADLALDLGHFLAGEPIQARPVGPVEKIVRWCRRNPVVACLISTAAASLLAGFIGVVHYAVQARQSAAQAARDAEEARRQRFASDQRRYVAEINLAQRDWQDGNLTAALGRLDDEELYQSADRDLRGFEWYLLRRFCQLELRCWRGHTLPVMNIALSVDGKTLAAAAIDETQPGSGEVTLWDVAGGRELHRFPAAGVLTVALSPDGQQLAWAGLDRLIHIWDLTSQREVLALPGHPGRITRVLYAPVGRLLASLGFSDKQVHLWDLSSGKEAGLLKGHQASVTCGAFAADGRRFASGDERGQMLIWDVAGRRPLHVLNAHVGIVLDVAFGPGHGQWIASAGMDHTAKLWDAATGQERATVRGHAHSVQCVAFTPAGDVLATADSSDGGIRLWRVPEGTELLQLRGHTKEVLRLLFHPNQRILISGSMDRTIRFWDATAGTEPMLLGRHPASIVAVCSSRENGRLASVDAENACCVWDADTGELQARCFGGYSQNNAVALSPQGDVLAASGKDGAINLWSLPTGRLLHSWHAHTSEVTALAFAADGLCLASASLDLTAAVWAVPSAERLALLRGQEKAVRSLAFSPDGQTIATAADEPTIRLWHAATGELQQTLSGHESALRCVAFSPDGSALASVGDDAWLCLWELPSGQLRRTPHGHGSRARYLAFTPDGERLATLGGDLDHRIRIWHRRTFQPLYHLDTPDELYCLAFSPDGLRLVGAGKDRALWLWDARPLGPELIQQRRVLCAVRSYYAQLLLRPRVLEALRQDTELDDAARTEALNLAERLPEDVGSLVERCRELTRLAGRKSQDYDEARRLAEYADRLLPHHAGCLAALGAARYRTGRFTEALAALAEAEERSAERSWDKLHAWNLVFISLCHHALKQQESLGRAEQHRKDVEKTNPWIIWMQDPQLRQLVAELEATLRGRPGRP
jgi:WD40 repeat protein/serine/threonine protein kinase